MRYVHVADDREASLTPGHAEGNNKWPIYFSATPAKIAGVQPRSLLEARGWCVWWDRQIFIGEAFDKAIERELENAKGQYYRDVIADSAGPSRSDVSVNGYRG
jgi:hypothetical protein